MGLMGIWHVVAGYCPRQIPRIVIGRIEHDSGLTQIVYSQLTQLIVQPFDIDPNDVRLHGWFTNTSMMKCMVIFNECLRGWPVRR